LLSALILLGGLTYAARTDAQTGRQLEIEAGVGELDEDWLLSTRLAFYWFDEVSGLGCEPGSTGACTTTVKAAAQLPVRFELVDDEPSDAEVIRSEDWDDPGDYFRFVRFLEYGRPHETLYARFGELGSIVIGHGTIANGYLNTITTDDFHPGFRASANTTYGGLHLVINDVTAPHFLGVRGHVRPFGRTSYWNRLAIGVTAVSDFRAPLELAQCAEGPCTVGVRTRPEVSERGAATVVGLDVELAAIDTENWQVLPYVDVNAGQGFGAHLGTSAQARFGEEWTTELRLEARAIGPKYLPDYFGPLYEIERFRFSGWGSPVAAPKARVAASRAGTTYGGFGQLAVRWADYASLALAFSDHGESDDSSAWLRLSITPPGPVTLGAYWARLNTDPAKFAELDDALFVSEARVAIWGPLYVHGSYDRLFRLDLAGNYVAAQAWNAGAGAVFSF
jgi:hypothetical protein